jgi:hypothetical protein
MTNEQSSDQLSGKSWRITLGTWMFYVPFVMFFGAPIVIPFMGFSASEAAALIGGIIVVSEVVWFASIPFLGKEGFKRMKSQIFSFLKPRSGPISRSRHQAGVRMFTIGLLSQVLLGMVVVVVYFLVGTRDPNIPVVGLSLDQQAIAFCVIQIAAIACVVVSVYMLGADFWERLDHAFEW